MDTTGFRDLSLFGGEQEKTQATEKATGVYTRLVDAGQMLMDVILQPGQGKSGSNWPFTGTNNVALCKNGTDANNRSTEKNDRSKIYTRWISKRKSRRTEVMEWSCIVNKIASYMKRPYHRCRQRTTNNRMELMAAISRLGSFEIAPADQTLDQPEKYLTDALTKTGSCQLDKGWNPGQSGPVKTLTCVEKRL